VASWPSQCINATEMGQAPQPVTFVVVPSLALTD
jgi:hypothetical protein